MKLLIVTPTLGQTPLLEESVEAVAALGLDVEHIISAPIEQHKSLAAKYPDLPVVADRGSQGGMYGAINAGINAAQSDWEWFTYINDDDLLYPGFAEMVRKHLNKDNPEEFAYGVVAHIDETDKTLYPISVCPWPKQLKHLFPTKISPISQQGMLIKRSAVEQIGFFDERFRYAGDMDYWCRLYTEGARFKYYPKRIAGFRVHAEQLSKDLGPFETEKASIRAKYFPDREPFKEQIAKAMFRGYNFPKYLGRIPEVGFKTSDQVMTG